MSSRRRFVIPVTLACVWMSKDVLISRLFPFGFPSKWNSFERPSVGLVDISNDSLRLKHGKLKKIYERGSKDLLRSPETVFFGPDGTMYTVTDRGQLISLTDFTEVLGHKIIATTTVIKELGPGRPLGAKFTSDGSTIYIADAVLGLLRVRFPLNPSSKVEIVASAFMDNGHNTRLNFADDLCIGPKSGKVYFTDASIVAPIRNPDMSYDVMYGSKIDALKTSPSGRLLEYDPTTDKVTVLARDLWFANGIAVDKEEQYLVFAETFRLSVGKYYLEGEKKGRIEYILDGVQFPGYILDGHLSPAYFDGVDCAWHGVTADTSYCYAANPSSVVPASRILSSLPHPVDWLLRTMLLMLPKEWLPQTQSYGGITVIDPGSSTNGYIGLIQDPTGEDIGHITGVTVHDNKLFLGSLENNYIGVYDLNG